MPIPVLILPAFRLSFLALALSFPIPTMIGIDNWSIRNFPLELLFLILSYLPVKSLVRFKSVSKSWKSVIEDPNFSSLHIKHCHNNIQNPYLLFCEAPPRSPWQWVLRRSETFQNYATIDFPREIRDKTWEVCNGVDGLILLVDSATRRRRDKNIILWNPSIKKVFHLPQPSIDKPFFIDLCLLFDSSSADYKVVMIHCYLPNSESSLTMPLVDVFSLKTLSWRRVVDRNRAPAGVWFSSKHYSACIGGVAHWIGGKSEGGSETVISFDVISNKFSFTSLPTRDVRDDADVEKRFIVLSDSILGLLEESILSKHVTIWAMERPSSTSSASYGRESTQPQCWTKRYEIDMATYGLKTFCVPVNMRNVLLWGNRGCDMETGELMIPSEIFLGVPVFINPYVESLLLLGSCEGLRNCSTITYSSSVQEL